MVNKLVKIRSLIFFGKNLEGQGQRPSHQDLQIHFHFLC